MVGGMAQDGGAPEWSFFMIPPGDYTVRDTWSTAGMRGTGSNTIVTDDVFVPDARVLRLSDLRQGKGPGAALHQSLIFRTPFFFYAPLTFAAPMLGAAQGAYAHFREWTKPRKSVDGSAVAEKTACRCRWRAPRPISTPPNSCSSARRLRITARKRPGRSSWRERSATSRGCRKYRLPPSTR